MIQGSVQCPILIEEEIEVDARSRRSDRPGGPAGEKSRIRPIGSFVNQLMSRRGYAQVLANEVMHGVVASVLDPHLKSAFQLGNLKGGVLQIYASDSVTLQEMNFRKRAIVKKLQQSMPESRITDIRFRVQT